MIIVTISGMLSHKDSEGNMATQWLEKGWGVFFASLEACQVEAEVECLCQAEIDAWRARPGMKKESSLRVPLTDTRNEIRVRALPANVRAWALEHLNFSTEKWIAVKAGNDQPLSERQETRQLLRAPGASVAAAGKL